MALCLPLSFSNPKPVASLSSSFVHGGTKPSSFSINEKLKTGNRLQNVSVSISCSSIKLVHDRALDKHVVMKYRVRFVQKLKTLLLSKSKHYIPVHILCKCRSYLGLPKPRSILSMIHRYPSIFELFNMSWPPKPLNATKLHPKLCVRLTPAAAAVAAEELAFQSSISNMLAAKLQKLLMLSSRRKLLLSKLVHFAPHLGLPPNFRSRLCNDHPEKFRTVDTPYGRALELVSWDVNLAKCLPPRASRDPGFIVDRPLKFKQLRLRKGLNLKRRHQDFLLRFEEMPEVCPYRNPAEAFSKESLEAEKRSCAVVREILAMTIEKRTLIDHLTHFRKDFGFPNKLRGMIIRHPELFYVSLKGQRHSVFLVEGFGEKGDLLEKEEILSIQDKWMDLARESKRMRRERRKSRFRKDIGSLNEADKNNSDSDDDYDDNIGIDNFENVYDDGFENIFEELDFEAEDDDDDQGDKIFSQSNYGEFWTAEPFPIQHGTNGTDSEFYNPKKKAEKEYLTFLAGFRQLAPKDVILNNLALSDVDLQDLIANADSLSSEEVKDDKGQLYYVYEIDGVGTHSLISVTCAKNKLYAHFVNAPTPEWNRDKDMLRHVHESFKTVGSF